MVRTLVIRDVDERANYHKDQNYPHLIFLSTVLRWAVNGTAFNDQDTEKIIKDNDKALASMAAFLADKIQDKTIPIYHVGTKLQLGSSEINPILLRLQSMDVSSNVQGLADKDGTYYYLGGKQLYTVIVESGPNTNNIFHKGNVWYRLVNDAPPEWKNAQAANQSPPATVESKGITKQLVANAFEGIPFDHDHWIKNLATPPKWLLECRVAKGSKKASATWNPVLIAAALFDKEIPIKKLDAVFVDLNSWADEWQEASASFRD